HAGDAAVAAATAAIYRLALGDPAAAQSTLDWAVERDRGPAATALSRFAEAVRWLHARAGTPPRPQAGEDLPALTAAAVLIEAVTSENVVVVERAAELSRAAALD